jgi:PhnB protein
MSVKPIPAGFHALTPHLIVTDGAAAIEFYKAAFGAVELNRSPMPNGKLMHTALHIGDSAMFLADEFPARCNAPIQGRRSPVTLHLYVEDADEVFSRAIVAGAEVSMPMMDAFWGNRYGQVTDPFGHSWSIATRKEIVSAEEADRRAKAMSGAKSLIG